MRGAVVWDNKVHDREGVKQCIYAVAFRPDGQQLIAAAGMRSLYILPAPFWFSLFSPVVVWSACQGGEGL